MLLDELFRSWQVSDREAQGIFLSSKLWSCWTWRFLTTPLTLEDPSMHSIQHLKRAIKPGFLYQEASPPLFWH